MIFFCTCIEFSAWLHDCHEWRVHMITIYIFFLATVAAFALMILLLLSAAFTSIECIPWAEAVGRSLLMQIIVTDPLLALGVVGLKLIGSYVLLQTNKKHIEKTLNKKIQLLVSCYLSLYLLCSIQTSN